MRQPSFLKAKGLETLLHDWAEIKKTREYRDAVEQSKQRTEEQTQQKSELPNVRIQINRIRRRGEDADELLLDFEEKEKSYGRGKQHHPPGAYLASNQIFSAH